MQSDKLELFYDEEDEIESSPQTTQVLISSSKQVEKIVSNATNLSSKIECLFDGTVSFYTFLIFILRATIDIS
jgi:hypothetical protein